MKHSWAAGPLPDGWGPGNLYRLPPPLLSSTNKILFRNTVGAQAFDVYNHNLEIKTRTNMAVLTVVFLKIRWGCVNGCAVSEDQVRLCYWVCIFWRSGEVVSMGVQFLKIRWGCVTGCAVPEDQVRLCQWVCGSRRCLGCSTLEMKALRTFKIPINIHPKRQGRIPK